MKVMIHRPDSGKEDVIEIEEHDVWNMDYTLSSIIVPMLKRLKDDKHGYPDVDNADVPDSYRTKDCPPDYGFCPMKWEYVLNEMIYAHTRILSHETVETPEEFDRIQNGLRLFAKYYRALWT